MKGLLTIRLRKRPSSPDFESEEDMRENLAPEQINVNEWIKRCCELESERDELRAEFRKLLDRFEKRTPLIPDLQAEVTKWRTVAEHMAGALNTVNNMIAENGQWTRTFPGQIPTIFPVQDLIVKALSAFDALKGGRP
jgi:hypothetical protein